MALAQSLDAALNKGFAYNYWHRRNSGYRSKVGGGALVRGAASNTGFTVISLAGITCDLETEMLILTVVLKKYLKKSNTVGKYLNTNTLNS